MTNNKIVIRTIEKNDLAHVINLMHQLAEFEGYADKFYVTVNALEEAIFQQQKLEVLVAVVDSKIEGICVFYTLPFTYDLKPWFYLKELFINSNCRSSGLGKALMFEFLNIAQQRGVSKIRWEVLKTNSSAIKFYQKIGGVPESTWALFSLDEKNY